MTNHGQTEPKPNALATPLPKGFGRRAADRIPAAALLEKAAELIGQTSKSSEGDDMPKALADQKAADRKAFMKKGHTAPKHTPTKVDPTDPFGLAAKASGKTVDTQESGVVESGHSNPTTTQGTTMTEPVKTKQELAEEATKAKMAAKAEKIAAAEKTKAEKEEKAKIAAAEKKAQSEKTAAERAEAKRIKDEQKQAEAAEKLAGDGRNYTGSMLALAARVKAGAYVKGSHGQLRSNDDLAVALDSVPPANVVKLAMEVLGETENKYASLNVGQQSMNYRNRLRGALKKALEVNGVKVTLDLIKEVRDNNSYAVEPAPKVKKEPKPATTNAPAPQISDAAASTGLPA
jgi:hypothetical protein